MGICLSKIGVKPTMSRDDKVQGVPKNLRLGKRLGDFKQTFLERIKGPLIKQIWEKIIWMLIESFNQDRVYL